MIRWLSSEIRIFAYLKNLPLIASFLGLGLGCACSKESPGDSSKYFPLTIGILCSCAHRIFWAAWDYFLPFPIGDYLIVGNVTGGFDYATLATRLGRLIKFLGVVIAVFGLCVYVFLALGQKLGAVTGTVSHRYPRTLSIFLASLLGVLTFSLISLARLASTCLVFLGFVPTGSDFL